MNRIVALTLAAHTDGQHPGEANLNLGEANSNPCEGDTNHCKGDSNTGMAALKPCDLNTSEADSAPSQVSATAPSLLCTPPDHVRLIRTLGNGRAATAELVEATWADGRRQQYVEKVFAPGLLTRVIYRLAFAAPFAYQSNRHAILACFYRRRVASGMLNAQTTCDTTAASAHPAPAGPAPASPAQPNADQLSRVDVAQPAYVRYDQPRQAWVLAADFIQGRGPIPGSLSREESSNTDEMSDLVGQMSRAESKLIEMGLVGSGWQVSPGALVSTANLLIPTSAKFRVVHPTGEPQPKQHVENRYTIIDLESGIPAVLLPRYLWQGWSRGSLFPFDDLDPQQLQLASERTAIQLAELGQTDQAATLRHDVAALLEHDRKWKSTEVAPFRKPWTWFSSQRWHDYRGACIERWSYQGSVDPPTQARLQSSVWLFATMWIAGLCHPSSLGRWLQAWIGNQEHRRRAHRFASDSRCRTVFLKRYRSKKVRQWLQQERCDNACTPKSHTGFLTQRLLGRLAPVGIHRYCVDSRRRYRRHRQALALITRERYQAARGRQVFGKTVARWKSRHWLSEAQAADLTHQFNGPQLAVYSRGFAMHLAIKLLYPVMAPFKVGGVAVALAGGSLWYAILPLMMLPMMRTVVTLASLLANRSSNVPHRHALCVGVIPTFGSAAFIVQMWSTSPQVSTFLLRDMASRLARKIPIYGGPDSRTEHAVLAFTDRLIQSVTQCTHFASNPSNMLNRKSQTVTSQQSPFSISNMQANAPAWWPYPHVIRDSLVLMVVCCGGLWGINYFASAQLSDQWLTGENGVIETTQVLVLVAAALSGIIAYFRTEVSSWRTIAIALTCVALAGVAREIPALETMPDASTDKNLASNSLIAAPRIWKHIAILLTGIVCVSRAAYAWIAYPEDRKLWLSPSFIWPVIPFVSCFVLAELFERASWVIAEESIEVFAYGMMTLSGIWIGRHTKSLTSTAACTTEITDDSPATLPMGTHPIPAAIDETPPGQIRRTA
ncbi:hypothetical protein SAMN06265222_102342 [Neorhodopirellula lusitana]|uniref:Uncharacterized protein n=1 Tax=Neorhodopirellula lusitana TaxID=445327 RepID=A0ABY1PU74_9BACT|nr:hypothetical protein [Neorhodopirellula lusitana]SMP47821.1 hypothetical protein SAMN06265222_102342 [Neorhodopirellula lusitana]